MTYVEEVPTNFNEMIRTNPDAVIRQYLEIAGFDSDGPWTTLDVLKLVTGFGFDCDSRHLTYLLGRNVIDSPRKFGAALAWRITDIQGLLIALDDSRRWLAGFHQNRKTQAELERDNATVDQAMRMLEHYAALETHELESLLQGSTSSPNREWLIRALREKRMAEAE